MCTGFIIILGPLNSWKDRCFGSCVGFTVLINRPSKIERFSCAHSKWLQLSIIQTQIKREFMKFGALLFVDNRNQRERSNNKLLHIKGGRDWGELNHLNPLTQDYD